MVLQLSTFLFLFFYFFFLIFNNLFFSSPSLVIILHLDLLLLVHYIFMWFFDVILIILGKFFLHVLTVLNNQQFLFLIQTERLRSVPYCLSFSLIKLLSQCSLCLLVHWSLCYYLLWTENFAVFSSRSLRYN